MYTEKCGNNEVCEMEMGEISNELNELSASIAYLGDHVTYLGEKLMPIRVNSPKGAQPSSPTSVPSLTEIGSKIAVLKGRINEICEFVRIIKSEVSL